MNEEASWIERSQKGDTRAYELLVRQYEHVAFRAAWLITRDAHAAAEVSQEAFLRAYRSLSSFRRGLPFRPWLLRIVTNQALNHVKSAERRARLSEQYARVMAMNEPNITAEQELSVHEQNRRLLDAVERLDPDERTLLALRYFLELSEREVADALQIPLGTCKSRLHRTLAKLRGIIRSDFPDLVELS